MKIVALVKVGNENETIESFVRYNMNFVDTIVIVSSCCIDNTLAILRKLIEEGLDVRLNIETDIAYDERYLDNKYLKQIVGCDEFDLIVPLDADEFISGEGNPRLLLESLSRDEVSIVKWLNYAICEDDDFDEPFIPARLKRRKDNYEGNEIKKVILPTAVVKKTNLTLTAGRHSVIGNNIKLKEINNLWIAHFPVVSIEQYKSMIYSESIKSIIRYNMGNKEGNHKYKQRIGLERGENLFELANGYGLSREEQYTLVEDPLDISFCKSDSCRIKYLELSKTDAMKDIWRTGQLMAIKAYLLDIQKQFDKNLPIILIYGAGKSADMLFDGIDAGVVNVLAYIDNDPVKELRIYNGRLVIPPDYIRFFKFDRIIISSDRYYEEMYSSLIENFVEESVISGAGYLIDKMLEKREKGE